MATRGEHDVDEEQCSVSSHSPAALGADVAASISAPPGPQLIEDLSGPRPPTDAAEGRTVELIEDNAGPVTPFCTSETGSSKVVPNKTTIVAREGRAASPGSRPPSPSGGPEIFCDDVGPDGPAPAPVKASGGARRTGAFLETIDDTGSAPTPFDRAGFGDGDLAKKRQGHTPGRVGPPARDHTQDFLEPANDSGVDDEPPQASTNGAANVSNNHSSPNTDFVDDGEETDQTAGSVQATDAQRPSLPEIEAYLVQESEHEIIVATHVEPPLPWWKERKAKMLFAFFLFLTLTMAVALAVAFSLENTVVVASLASSSPSSSASPTIQTTTDSPSSSAVPTSPPTVLASSFPSSSPTACAQSISSNAQKIQLPISNPSNPKVAMDGTNMVVVAKETYASKVRLQLDRTESLELAEVKVFDMGGANIALHKPSSHSSQFFGVITPAGVVQNDFSASKAVDGDTGTISHTDEELGAWFEVDLREPADVRRVEIWSRQDCCQERLINATISLVDGAGQTRAVATINDSRLVHSFDIASFTMMPDVGNDSVHVIFLSFVDNVWETTSTFLEMQSESDYSVALSGKRALIGLPHTKDGSGSAFIYEQKDTGYWDKTGELQTGSNYEYMFGRQVDIDGDLACVVGDEYVVNFFSREVDGRWTPIDLAFARACSISDNTFATRSRGWRNELELFEYDEKIGEMNPIQDAFEADVYSMAVSNDYLVYWDMEEQAVFIYHRGEPDGLFALSDRMWVSTLDFYDYDHNHLAVDGDSLVIGDKNGTRIFSDQSGEWVEIFRLGQSYENYYLDGRHLLATGDLGIFSFDIKDCVQSMPTGVPSLSASPTVSPIPSHSPTFSVRPSSRPTLSAPPSHSFPPTETCHEIQFAIAYDPYPKDMRWTICGVGHERKVVLAESFVSAEGGVETICLPEGDYELILSHGIKGDDNCCWFENGHYNVTSNGLLVAHGGEFQGFAETETAQFSLPFVPAPSEEPSSSVPSNSPSIQPSRHPSSSQIPSIGPSHSVAPSESASPTETCFWVDIDVIYDHKPQDTLLRLGGEIDAIGLRAELISHTGSSGDTSFSRSLCLQEGEYEFEIIDWGYDGICCRNTRKGHYSVSSNGLLIAEGGEFSFSESTVFYLPLVPAPDGGHTDPDQERSRQKRTPSLGRLRF